MDWQSFVAKLQWDLLMANTRPLFSRSQTCTWLAYQTFIWSSVPPVQSALTLYAFWERLQTSWCFHRFHLEFASSWHQLHCHHDVCVCVSSVQKPLMCTHKHVGKWAAHTSELAMSKHLLDVSSRSSWPIQLYGHQDLSRRPCHPSCPKLKLLVHLRDILRFMSAAQMHPSKVLLFGTNHISRCQMIFGIPLRALEFLLKEIVKRLYQWKVALELVAFGCRHCYVISWDLYQFHFHEGIIFSPAPLQAATKAVLKIANSARSGIYIMLRYLVFL